MFTRNPDKDWNIGLRKTKVDRKKYRKNIKSNTQKRQYIHNDTTKWQIREADKKDRGTDIVKGSVLTKHKIRQVIL